MSALSVTRTLVSFTNPEEDQFDDMRDELLAFFNGTSLDSTNFAAAGQKYSKLSKALDNVNMKFTDSDALIGYVSATPTFKIENAIGDIVFRNTNAAEAESLRLSDAGTLTLGSGGLVKAGQGVGSQAVDTMWLFSKYRKPRLEYTSADIVTAENNTSTSDQTIILIRDRLCTLIDRTLSLAATANGYESDDTGAAVSGLETGVARTVNNWYYVYAVRVQYGDDANGTNAILVASQTSPIQANTATLNTEFGTGTWVYMGLIRNGYNDGVNTNIIVPFQYDEYGMLWFRTTTETGKGNGVRLATATGSSSDLTYTIAFGVGAAQIPAICTRAVFTGYRSSSSFTLDYESNVTGETNLTQCNCDNSDANTESCVNLEVPLISGYILAVRVGTDSTNNRIMLAAVVDHYV